MLHRIININETQQTPKLALDDLVELIDKKILYPKTELSDVAFIEENFELIEREFDFSALAFKTMLEDYSKKLDVADMPCVIDYLEAANYCTFAEKLLNYPADDDLVTFLPYINDQHSLLAIKIGRKTFVLDSTDSFYVQMKENDFLMVNDGNFYFVTSTTQKDGVNCKTFALSLIENISNTLCDYLEKYGGDEKRAVMELGKYLSSFFLINTETNVNLPEKRADGLEILPPEMAILNQSYKELSNIILSDRYREETRANRELLMEFEKLKRIKDEIASCKTELETALKLKELKESKPLNKKRVEHVGRLSQLVKKGVQQYGKVGMLRRSANIDFLNYK